MEQFTDIETAALEMLLAGDHPILNGLRQQLPTLAIRERILTGGFFLAVQAEATTLGEDLSVIIGDVGAHIVEIECHVEFLLFIKAGKIRKLECCSYVFEDWPTNPTLDRMFYIAQSAAGAYEVEERSLEAVISRPSD